MLRLRLHPTVLGKGNLTLSLIHRLVFFKIEPRLLRLVIPIRGSIIVLKLTVFGPILGLDDVIEATLDVPNKPYNESFEHFKVKVIFRIVFDACFRLNNFVA